MSSVTKKQEERWEKLHGILRAMWPNKAVRRRMLAHQLDLPLSTTRKWTNGKQVPTTANLNAIEARIKALRRMAGVGEGAVLAAMQTLDSVMEMCDNGSTTRQIGARAEEMKELLAKRFLPPLKELSRKS